MHKNEKNKSSELIEDKVKKSEFNQIYNLLLESAYIVSYNHGFNKSKTSFLNEVFQTSKDAVLRTHKKS